MKDEIIIDVYDDQPDYASTQTIFLRKRSFFLANRFYLPSMLLGFVIGLTAIVLLVCTSAHAQPPLHFKTVTFENANDLGLRVQRIEAVVDTVRGDSVLVAIDTLFIGYDGSTEKRHFGYETKPGRIVYITRREVEFVAVLPYPPDGNWTYKPPYRALIGWREIKD